MAAAQAYIGSNIFHSDRIGIIGGDVFNAFLHVLIYGGADGTLGRVVHKQRKCGVESAGHFNSMLEFTATGIVDVQKLPLDIITHRSIFDHRMFSGKIGSV